MCPACGGKGVSARFWCKKCGGEGSTQTPCQFRIKIPAGMPYIHMIPAGAICCVILGMKGVSQTTVLLQELIMAAFCVSMVKEMWALLAGNVVTSCSGSWCVLILLASLQTTVADCCYSTKHGGRLQINPEDSLIRRGSDVFSTIPVAYTDAILGAQLDVQTLRGTKSVRIPAGTQHGTTIKLYEQGVQGWGAASSTCGIHHLTLHVILPPTCGQEEVQLLERLRSLTGC